jgi:hypothetical protein
MNFVNLGVLSFQKIIYLLNLLSTAIVLNPFKFLDRYLGVIQHILYVDHLLCSHGLCKYWADLVLCFHLVVQVAPAIALLESCDVIFIFPCCSVCFDQSVELYHLIESFLCILSEVFNPVSPLVIVLRSLVYSGTNKIEFDLMRQIYFFRISLQGFDC